MKKRGLSHACWHGFLCFSIHARWHRVISQRRGIPRNSHVRGTGITAAQEDSFPNTPDFGAIDNRSPVELWVGGFQALPNAPVTVTWWWVTVKARSTEPMLVLTMRTGSSERAPNDARRLGTEHFMGINLDGNFGWNNEGNMRNITGYVAEYSNTVPEPAKMILFGSSPLNSSRLIAALRKTRNRF